MYDPAIHKRHSIRLKDFDYSQDGYYFVTICTKNRIECFGKIKNGKIILSKIGEIVCEEWIKTGQIRKNIQLDEWIVMPNHVHGIVVIDGDNVGAYCNTPLQTKRFKSPSNNLGSIIRSFKSSVKRHCNQNNFHYFQWQRNYYEHVIRNNFELNRIREYIINNPIQWECDRNNLKNITPPPSVID